MRAGADLRMLRAAVFAAACAALAAAGHLAGAGPGIALWALAAGWAAVFAVALPLAGRERRSVPGIAAALALGQLVLHCLYCLGQHGAATASASATARAAGTHSAHGAHGAHEGGDDGVMAIAARLLCNDHAVGLTGEKAARIVAAAGLDPATGPGVGTPAATAVTGPVPVAHHGAAATGGGLADAVASLGSPPMLLGHLLAAIAAAWLLRRGEAALWRLVRLSAPLAAPLARAVVEALAFALSALLRALRRALRLTLGTSAYATGARPPGRRAHHATPATTGVVLPHALTRRGPPPHGHPHAHLTLAA